MKTVKRSLKVITRGVFTEESLYKFLCEVEPVINNHPLIPTSDSISDFEAFTTNYFLLETKVTNYALGIVKSGAVQAALSFALDG